VHGKQRRTKTRKEKAEEGSSESARDPEHWPDLSRTVKPVQSTPKPAAALQPRTASFQNRREPA
jgi:hypothetical protein